MTAPHRLSEYSHEISIGIGQLLVVVGGMLYVIFSSISTLPAIILITIGIVLLLQLSRGFQVKAQKLFIMALVLSCMLVGFVDYWLLQLVYGLGIANCLQFLSVESQLFVNPHFGGVQILLFVQEFGSGRLIGGEIDNACAGLIVIIPCILLLVLSDYEQRYRSNRLVIGFLSLSLILIGNFCRILCELWLPAVGIISFDLAHYPMALILGILGLIVITLIGHHNW